MNLKQETNTYCACCKRYITQLSKHHLIPRTLHHKKKIKKEFDRVQLNHAINLCNPCHNQIHSLFTEKELGRQYYSLELIMANSDMMKFAAWIKNKPQSVKPCAKRHIDRGHAQRNALLNNL